MARPGPVTRHGAVSFYLPKTALGRLPFGIKTRRLNNYNLFGRRKVMPSTSSIQRRIRRQVGLSMMSHISPASIRLVTQQQQQKRRLPTSLNSPETTTHHSSSSISNVTGTDSSNTAPDQTAAASPRIATIKPRTRDLSPEQKEDIMALSTLDAPASQHSSLTSFLVHAERTGLSPTSSVYRGTFYEYAASASLLPYGIVLNRVGGRSDGGIDLWGRWYLDFQDRSPRARAQVPASAATGGGDGGDHDWCYVACQCKNISSKVSPSVVRELEGALAAFKAKLGKKRNQSKPMLGLLATTQPSTPGVRAALAKSDVPLGFVCVPFTSDSSIPPSLSSSPLPDESHVIQFSWNAAATKEIGLRRVGVVVKYPGLYKLPLSGSPAGKDQQQLAGANARPSAAQPRGELVLTFDGKPLMPYNHPPSLPLSISALEVINASTDLVKASKTVLAHVARLQTQIKHLADRAHDVLALEAFVTQGDGRNPGTHTENDPRSGDDPGQSSTPTSTTSPSGASTPSSKSHQAPGNPQAELDRILLLLLSFLDREFKILNPITRQVESLAAHRAETKLLELSRRDHLVSKPNSSTVTMPPAAIEPALEELSTPVQSSQLQKSQSSIRYGAVRRRSMPRARATIRKRTAIGG